MSLLNLPLDMVPFRSPGELLHMVAPVYPSWLRRNEAPIALGQESPEDIYMLYTTYDGKLYRIDVGVRDDSTTRFSTALSRWNMRANQTRMSIPWDLLSESYSALPESRDMAAQKLMADLVSLSTGSVLREWRTPVT